MSYESSGSEKDCSNKDSHDADICLFIPFIWDYFEKKMDSFYMLKLENETSFSIWASKHGRQCLTIVIHYFETL